MIQTVLGAGGAIGVELAKSLPLYTQNVRLVSRNPKPVTGHEELFSADLMNASQLDSAIQGSSVVYLTVGLDYSTRIWQEKWPPLMQGVIDACIRNGSKLVFFDNVYMIGGDNVKHINEQSPVSPVSRKGEVRARLDRMLLDASEKKGLPVIIARAADFYGPVKDKSVIMETVYKNLVQGKKPQWFCNPHKVHSFTYTPDAGKGTAMLGNTPDAFNQIWNLPTDATSLTGKDWINLFTAAMNLPDKGVQAIPKWMLKTLGLFIPIMKEFHEMAYQYDRDYFFDSSKFNNHFNFIPVKPENGIKATLAAMQK
jgi:nucleoside-diphosphate-sugar epimerase